MSDLFDRMHDARRAADAEFEAAQYASDRPMTAPELTEAEAAVVARFEAAPYPADVAEAQADREAHPYVGDIRDDRYVWNGSVWVDYTPQADR